MSTDLNEIDGAHRSEKQLKNLETELSSSINHCANCHPSSIPSNNGKHKSKHRNRVHFCKLVETKSTATATKHIKSSVKSMPSISSSTTSKFMNGGRKNVIYLLAAIRLVLLFSFNSFL